jgi:regulatory protein SWI6
MTSVHPTSSIEPESTATLNAVSCDVPASKQDTIVDPSRATTPEDQAIANDASKSLSPAKTLDSTNTPPPLPRKLTGAISSHHHHNQRIENFTAATATPNSMSSESSAHVSAESAAALSNGIAVALTPILPQPQNGQSQSAQQQVNIIQLSPSSMATATPARRARSEAVTPTFTSSLGGRPPNPVPVQQRMLQSTFSVSTYGAPAGPISGGAIGSFSSKPPPPPSPKVDRSDEVITGIYTATYSGISVFEMMVHGIAVMRRRHDSSLNATQILKVAGVDKSKRTKILEREILIGTHEKVQGGYGKYQGTWIPYERGVDLCKQYSVFDVLQPLLEFDAANNGMENTPTKEQAMAARRKRITQYQPLHLAPPSTSSVLSFTNPLQVSGGLNTPLSHLASEALTNLGKATRSDTVSSPAASSSSHQTDDAPLSARHTLSVPVSNSRSEANTEGPSRKKQRKESSPSLPPPTSITNTTTTTTLIEDDHFEIDEDAVASTLTPLKPLDIENTPNFENSKLAITQVFVSTENTNLVDILGGEDKLESIDLDVPIDDLQHTALHWASVLGRISLVKDLIKYGANILRGNYAGETGLIRAVLVTNNFDGRFFSKLLDLLYPAIPLVDNFGRSVLHHIALTAGIKGRSDASIYYLSSLLKWIYTRGSRNKESKLSLGRFIQDVVNAQDKNGDTALNIAARVGDKNIAQLLLEVGADATIPNRAGLRPTDFGILIDGEKRSDKNEPQTPVAPLTTSLPAASRPDHSIQGYKEDQGEVVESIKSLITEIETVFAAEYKKINDEIQKMREELRESNQQLEAKKKKLEKLKNLSDTIVRDKQRATNLERALEEEEANFKAEEERHGRTSQTMVYSKSQGSPDEPYVIQSIQKSHTHIKANNESSVTHALIRNAVAQDIKTNPHKYQDLPSHAALKARVLAYRENERRLVAFTGELRGRSAELEQKFRRIVAQCASIKEDQVDSLLEGLVQAVESDPGEVDLSRVAGFLRKVDDGVTF